MDFPNVEHEYVMMIDDRAGPKKGTILEHPLIDELRKLGGVLPESLSERKLQLDELEDDHFYDPMGKEIGGEKYRKPVNLQTSPSRDSGVNLFQHNRQAKSQIFRAKTRLFRSTQGLCCWQSRITRASLNR